MHPNTLEVGRLARGALIGWLGHHRLLAHPMAHLGSGLPHICTPRDRVVLAGSSPPSSHRCDSWREERQCSWAPWGACSGARCSVHAAGQFQPLSRFVIVHARTSASERLCHQEYRLRYAMQQGKASPSAQTFIASRIKFPRNAYYLHQQSKLCQYRDFAE